MENKTAVVILNFNGRNFLKEFLPFVLKYTTNAEIIVADNASTDDSIDVLKKEFSEVKILQLQKNHGFAGGYNQALEKIDAKYFILLNSDVEVTQNWLDPIVQLLDSQEGIVAVQPKILAFHDKQKFEYAGAAGGFIDWLGYPFCRGRIFNETETDLGQYNERKQIFWATGACMAIRSKTFFEMGGFDEYFFAHMEEIDLCWRINSAGGKIFYEPQSTVFHVGGGTLNKSNPKKTFLNYRNGLLMLYKNLPTGSLVSVIFLRLILDGVSSLLFLKKLEFSNIWAIIKSHFAFYAAIFSGKVKRNSNNVNSDLVYRKSIVFQHFLFCKKKYADL